MTMVRRGVVAAALVAATLAVPPVHAETSKGPTVFAAASMKTALDAISAAYTAHTGKKPIISYASSGVLAKQIAAGAPADLFISADEKWMNVLDKEGMLRTGTRENLLGNTLVLVQPTTSPPVALTIAKGFDLAGALGGGKLAVCTVSSCPAGIYGKQALESLGIWAKVAPDLAEAENVRAALLLVARGEAKFGIVYGTDAKVEPQVRVVGTFPASSHAPIVYPVAVIKDAKDADAGDFEMFLHSPAATKILTDQGFAVLSK